MARGRKGRGQRPSTFPKPETQSEAQRSPPAPGDLEARLAALSSGVSRAREESESRASTATRRRRIAVVAAALAVVIGTVGLILGTVGSSHSPKSVATGSSQPTATTVAVSGSTTPAVTTAPPTTPVTAPPTTASPPSTTPPSTAPPSPTTTPPSTATPPLAGPAQVTVRAGDNFWTIARAHEQQVLGHQPTDAQTGRYWVELVAANTSHLVQPGNPNLIYPGQTLVLPD